MRSRELKRILAALLLAALVAGPATTQTEPSATAPQTEPSAAPATPDGAGEPVADATPPPRLAPPTPPFDAKAATEAYLARQTAAEKERSDSYFEGGYWLILWNFLYGAAILWALLATGISARMRDLAERLVSRRPLQTALYAVQYVVLTTVASFPLTLYQRFFREHQYGLATQTFGPWFRQFLIGLAVSAVMASLALIVLYGVFRRAPRTWWLWGSLVAVLFLVLLVLIAPVYIDPLFNTYEPLADERVLAPILSMARANGIDADNVWQFDASRQSKRISANVSGFAGTMRIRLNDNLLERCSQEEIEAVMAHEIGHYALRHIYESILFFAIVLVGGFGFVRWAFDRVIARWGMRWRVHGIGDVAGLPLLMLLLSVYFFALTPVLNTYIRVNEAEADIFGLNAARQPDGFAEVALKLGEYRKLDPTPFEEWFFFDHPSGRSRIEMAMRWKAEQVE